MNKLLLLTVLSLLFFNFNSNLYSADPVDNGNGVIVTTYDYREVLKIHAEWFTAYDPEDTVNYVYNESAGTSTTSGALDNSWIFDKGTVLVDIPTFGTGTVTVRIEGKTEGSSVWANVYTKAYTAATTIAEAFNIVSYWDQIRVGLLVTGSAVDSVSVEADFITHKGGN